MNKIFLILVVFLVISGVMAVPVAVFDVPTGTVTEVTDVSAGLCRYNNAGKLLCPGNPNKNVGFCLGLAVEDQVLDDGSVVNLCEGDSQCILDTVQECVDSFGDVNVVEKGLQPDGSCPVAEALMENVGRKIDNCPDSWENWSDGWGRGCSNMAELYHEDPFMIGNHANTWQIDYFNPVRYIHFREYFGINSEGRAVSTYLSKKVMQHDDGRLEARMTIASSVTTPTGETTSNYRFMDFC